MNLKRISRNKDKSIPGIRDTVLTALCFPIMTLLDRETHEADLSTESQETVEK